MSIDKEFWERVERRENDLSWLHETKPDGSPLDDVDIRMPLEPAWMTELRTLEGGPYYVTPDSGEEVPPDFYADVDPAGVRRDAEAATQKPPEVVTPDGKTVLPDDQRALLEHSGPAGRKLLEELERGLEAGTPEFREAIQERRRRAGLL